MGAAPDALPVEPAESSPLDHFRTRSNRFLFAQPRGSATGDDDGDLVYLEQGTANKRRAFAREHLMCPVPDCSSPEITTVSREPRGYRDGYRHLVRPDRDHEPEGMFHRQAKALVARWARTQPGVAAAVEEARVGDRVADVLLTSESGNRLAVEIQYASLSIEDWHRRTTSYVDQGVAITWLWGHVGAHSPLAKRWRAIGRRLAETARPVIWVNPAEDRVVWAYDVNRMEKPPLGLRDPQYVFGKTFDDLTITREGIRPKAFLEDARAVRERLAEDERRRADARRRKAEYAERVAAARERRALAEATGDVGSPKDEAIRYCQRCGGRLDPALSTYHADPFCDRWRSLPAY